MPLIFYSRMYNRAAEKRKAPSLEDTDNGMHMLVVRESRNIGNEALLEWLASEDGKSFYQRAAVRMHEEVPTPENLSLWISSLISRDRLLGYVPNNSSPLSGSNLGDFFYILDGWQPTNRLQVCELMGFSMRRALGAAYILPTGRQGRAPENRLCLTQECHDTAASLLDTLLPGIHPPLHPFDWLSDQYWRMRLGGIDQGTAWRMCGELAGKENSGWNSDEWVFA